MQANWPRRGFNQWVFHNHESGKNIVSSALVITVVKGKSLTHLPTANTTY